MLKQRHQLFVILFVVADAAFIVAACMLAWVARHALTGQPYPSFGEPWFAEPLLPVAIPLTILVLWASGLYRPRRDGGLLRESLELSRAAIIAALALVAVTWGVGDRAIGIPESVPPASILGAEIDPARTQLGSLAILLPLLLVSHRLIIRVALRMLRKRGRNLRHVAVIGVGRLGQIAARTLARNSWTGLNVAFHIDHAESKRRDQCLGREVAGGLDDLEQILESRRIDAVYLALPASDAAKVPAVLRRLERYCLDVKIIPDVPVRYMPQNMRVSELEGMPILSCRESPLYGLGGASKRMLDIAVGAIAMLVFSPLMLAIAGIIRMTSSGPIIFRQRRVSLGGEEFWIFKFRTMRHIDDEGPTFNESADAPAWTSRNDPRITRVGRWLRRTSLDELPQLINVMRGEMSLVGPRPERPELIDRFKEDWRGYMMRQHVKAGMTGWAQVNGLRGDTNLRKRLQLDLYYVRHWSIRFDLKILWLTLFRGFIHRNAH